MRDKVAAELVTVDDGGKKCTQGVASMVPESRCRRKKGTLPAMIQKLDWNAERLYFNTKNRLPN